MKLNVSIYLDCITGSQFTPPIPMNLLMFLKVFSTLSTADGVGLPLT
jgi:hypothetical protein